MLQAVAVPQVFSYYLNGYGGDISFGQQPVFSRIDGGEKSVQYTPVKMQTTKIQSALSISNLSDSKI